MSDRLAWLEQWCPRCQAAPGTRCRLWAAQLAGRENQQSTTLHVARGWFERPCPTCKAGVGSRCITRGGEHAARIHAERLRPARCELISHDVVWGELVQRGVTAAVVSFAGRAGRGGQAQTPEIVDAAGERVGMPWWLTEQLAYALQAPVWGRFATFNGLPQTRGELVWAVERRQLIVRGTRGDKRFEETIW